MTDGLIDWDAAFENGAHVPGSQDLAGIWAAQAAAFRQASQCELDQAYGPGARNRVDLFLPDGTARGCVVFVHGGYWHKFDKSFWSHLAAGPLAQGWAVAMPSYTLAPDARISEITQDVAQAIAFVAKKVDGPLRLAGHSAGGHLVTRMVCASSALPDDVAGRVEKVVSISGVHDLRPLVQTRMNEELRLTEAEATAESPYVAGPGAKVPVTFWVGAGERPEFLRQTRLIAEAWQEAGAPVRDVYEPGRNHFSVVEGLGDPDSALVAEILG
ncbi:alpha/beta hydrolase [Phaeobacter marinintestinus]|uniref:alpha/beta hydrolase n=1 Tax=Falsiphaeobacter marinintestinus TaxID=1492905 RepID=UPI0011B4E4E6|nr:alpha/beta hydrolase [Phaeobacter marinintestinus]